MDIRPTHLTESLTAYALPKAHPYNWTDEARRGLFLAVLLPAMELAEAAREAAAGPGGGSGGATGGAEADQDPDTSSGTFAFPGPEAMGVAAAFLARYAQLEAAPRVHLGAAVNHPLLLSAAMGVSGWPYARANEPLYDPTAHLVGRGIRAAAVSAARACRGHDLLSLARAEPPALARVLDRLHTFLVNAAVCFYHHQGAEIHGYLLDRQLVELMLEG